MNNSRLAVPQKNLALQQERKLDMLADLGCQSGRGESVMRAMCQKYKKPPRFMEK